MYSTKAPTTKEIRPFSNSAPIPLFKRKVITMAAAIRAVTTARLLYTPIMKFSHPIILPSIKVITTREIITGSIILINQHILFHVNISVENYFK
ncbi:hypothetical protein FR483_n411R [Paramecium bursaria Chlorella virus FR483]|uniref:Uncharacterized protein n411R n=1 Tax=Paramecium bursaria Chlorella virus FR483 TaxID=399781 RepID=A7J7B5_PBCVF|nr:hypothetical protein FR483_n411R [Paramecium bursaria Chlorella virus FR483]ABT15696.1 hypothetical protein FR483_n411R [Paramecium bursaria Chlorella virus FR483]